MGIHYQIFKESTVKRLKHFIMAEIEQQTCEDVNSVSEETEKLSVVEVSDEVSTGGEVVEDIGETSSAGVDSASAEEDGEIGNSTEAVAEVEDSTVSDQDVVGNTD